ncbi:hypothetical protein GCM10010452_22990 [Crossiella cryophila]|uniref:right-handed parallel beta-helix repeat-containing protein n=1 Tax=Crossiella cryophila TaxID=43355 RepID=UPI0031F0DAF3
MNQSLPSRRAALTGLAALSATALTGAGVAAAAPVADPVPTRVVDLGAIGVDRDGGGDPVENARLIQLALDKLTDNSVLLIPAGTYSIAPKPGVWHAAPILAIPPCRNLIVRGEGPASVLKVADPPAEDKPYIYGAVLGFAKGPVVPDLVCFTNFTIDHNCGKNKPPVEIESNGKMVPVLVSSISSYAYTPTFGRITVRHLTVHRADARVSLYFPGQADSGSVAVHDCLWTEASHRTGVAEDDHSFINATCTSLTVLHNRFHGVSWEKAPRTAIETHASNTVVQGNLIEKFQIGINITGNARHGGTTYRHLCQDNLIETSRDGILIWSHRYGTHQTANGFEDMTISGNHVTLRPEKYVGAVASGKGMRGIGVFAVKKGGEGEKPPPSIGFRNLVVAGNTIRYPTEYVVLDYVYLTELERRAGALSFAFLGTTAADAVYDNVRITGNTVYDCAFSGLYIEGGRWRGLQVDNNTFVDCAHSGSGRRQPAYNNKVLRISVQLLGDCVVSGNTFHTNPAPQHFRNRINGYLQVEHTGPERHRFLVSGNVIAIDPAFIPSEVTEYLHIAGANTQWSFDGSVPRASVPITNNAPGGTGSRIRVDQSEITATRTASGWQQQGSGTSAPTGGGFLPGDVWVNTAISAENPVHSWVCVTGGNVPVWRELRLS